MKLAVGVNVTVGMDVNVEVGREVRVGEGVQVGRGVLVEVRVHTMGVRVNVGVADNAAIKACICAVRTADVARTLWFTVGVGVMEAVAVGADVFVVEAVCGKDNVGDAVATTGWVGSGADV